MELRYGYVVVIGIVVIVVLSILRFKKKIDFTGGKLVAATEHYKENNYIKRRMVIYRILTVLLFAAGIFAIGVSFFIISRPYKKQIINKEEYSRDIIMCIDISYSVDALNMSMIEEMKDTVKNLKGERIGVVIFNTSPVLLVPLTDDYEYVIDTLDTIKEALKDREVGFGENDDWMYLSEYIVSGTIIGNEQVGSSLIGDGLAAAANDFSKTDLDRTKVIIFTTDNDLQGTPIFTLDEAATLCKEKNIVVYGVGTKEMLTKDMNDMKSAVEKTGGIFYLQEESGSMKQIVSNINKMSKSLVKVDREVRQVDIIKLPFCLLLCGTALFIILARITKR